MAAIKNAKGPLWSCGLVCPFWAAVQTRWCDVVSFLVTTLKLFEVAANAYQGSKTQLSTSRSVIFGVNQHSLFDRIWQVYTKTA